MSVESITVGKRFVTALDQIRQVTEISAGKVTYLVLGRTVLAGDELTTSKQRFARNIDREVAEEEFRSED